MAVSRSTDSQVPDVDNGLWERIRDAVQAETGADKSLWNGKLHYTPADRPGLRGSASSDGEVRLNESKVVEPLRDMYKTRGETVTAAQWTERRNALKTAGHEFAHLASPQDHTHADRLAGMQNLSYKPIEEGVTEAWSQSSVDRVADRALPQDLAEQVKGAKNAPHSYPAWEPAARSFADQIGAETGADGDEVLRRMAAEPRTGKAQAAADMLFESSELPDLVPAEQQQAVRQEIAADIDKGFAELTSLKENVNASTRSVSRQRGIEIADSATDVVRAAEDRYRGGPEQQQQREAGQQATRDAGQTDLSALPPPNPADRVQPATQQTESFAQQSPAQQQARLQRAGAHHAQPGHAQPGQAQPGQAQAGRAQPGQPQPGQGLGRPGQSGGRPGGADQDVAMRVALGAQTPAAGAPRVGQGQAAEGRRPNAHGAGHGASRTTDTPSR
jgi:hypothetical protein